MSIEVDEKGKSYKEKTDSLMDKAAQYMGMQPRKLSVEEHETDAPIAFTYSLYYVYYDQYTYIRGVLF